MLEPALETPEREENRERRLIVILLAIVLALVGYVLWLVRRRKQIEAERRRRRRAQMEAEEARRRAQMRETLHEFDRDHVGSGRR